MAYNRFIDDRKQEISSKSPIIHSIGKDFQINMNDEKVKLKSNNKIEKPIDCKNLMKSILTMLSNDRDSDETEKLDFRIDTQSRWRPQEFEYNIRAKRKENTTRSNWVKTKE